MAELQGIALGVGVIMTLATVDQTIVLVRAFASEKWSQVQGKIVHSTMGPASSTDPTPPDIQPLVRYRYAVDGKPYMGQTLSLGEGWWSPFGRRSPILDDFPVGATVSVYYNPRNPSESALMVGATLATYLRPVGTAAMVVWALFVLF